MTDIEQEARAEAKRLIGDLEAVRGYVGLSHYRGDRLTAEENEATVRTIVAAQQFIAAASRPASPTTSEVDETDEEVNVAASPAREAVTEEMVEQEARTVRLGHLLGVYRVGSRDWSWLDEYNDLIHQPITRQLLAAVKRDGITEPILLGTDGRVWDGHHRITVAMHLGLDLVPVEFAGASSLATRETVTEADARKLIAMARTWSPAEARVSPVGAHGMIEQLADALEAALTEKGDSRGLTGLFRGRRL